MDKGYWCDLIACAVAWGGPALLESMVLRDAASMPGPTKVAKKPKAIETVTEKLGTSFLGCTYDKD